MSEIGKIFGRNIAALREKAKYSKEFVAISLGVGATTISSWENGQRTPPLETCFAVADFYGVTLDSLINRNRDNVDDQIAKLSQEDAASIERVQKMKDAGYTDAEIAAAVEFAVEWKKKGRQ